MVGKPKGTENDPGGSQGSGNFYEHHSQKPPEAQSEAEPQAQEEPTGAKLSVVVAAEQIGMTGVVADFLEQKKSETSVSPGLSVRYTNDSQPAKGLLLNKKAE